MRYNGRELVFHAIAQSPGIHKSQLCQATRLAWGTVNYHVARLLEAGSIRQIASKKELLLFAAGLSEQGALAARAMSAPEARNIVLALEKHGHLSLADLCGHLALPRKRLERRMKVLCAAGVVHRLDSFRARYCLARQDIRNLQALEAWRVGELFGTLRTPAAAITMPMPPMTAAASSMTLSSG